MDNFEYTLTEKDLHLIICRAICDLKDIFPSIDKNYKLLKQNIIDEIDILNHFGISEQFDLVG